MNWMRVKNKDVLTAYVNLFEEIQPKRAGKILLDCFQDNVEDLVKWLKVERPDIDITNPIGNLEGDKNIIDALWSVRSIWDAFLERIVEPVNDELPGMVLRAVIFFLELGVSVDRRLERSGKRRGTKDTREDKEVPPTAPTPHAPPNRLHMFRARDL